MDVDMDDVSLEDDDRDDDNENFEDEPAPDVRRIEDMDAWLRRGHGLENNGESTPKNVHYHEAVERFREHEQYQARLHRQFFAADIAKSTQERLAKQARLLEWHQVTFSVVAAADGSRDGDRDTGTEVTIENVSLPQLASVCDTIFAWAANTSFGQPCSKLDNHCRPPKTKLIFRGLECFEQSSVCLFLNLVSLVHEYHADAETDAELTACPVVAGPEESSAPIEQIRNLLLSQEDGRRVTDCCEIASFLQCQPLLDVTEEVLCDAADVLNCYALCQLADQLHLTRLFEKALLCMTRSLSTMQNDEEFWENILPGELRGRIVAIQEAIQSSVHSHYGSRCRRIAFSSMEEYLAVFAEQVQYYRERLADAEQQQVQLESEIVLDSLRRRPWLFLGPSRPAHDQYRADPLWIDTQQKINRQKQRLKTLEAVLREHKSIFGCTATKFSFNKGASHR
jgi:hypothetical protein